MNTRSLFHFSVPTPCHEDWDKMSAADRGRFCASCKKVVRDFTHDSNEEVRRSYVENNGKLCGRFLSSQLIDSNFSYHLSRSHVRQFRHFFLALLLAFGSALFSFQSADAAEYLHKTKQKVLRYDCQKSNSDSVITIAGRVQDKDNKEGIAFSNILLSENDIVIAKTVADIDGNFKFIVHKSLFKDKRNLVLKAGGVGYRMVEIKNFMKEDRDTEHITLEIAMSEIILGGAVIQIVEAQMIDPFYPNHRTIGREQWNNMPK